MILRRQIALSVGGDFVVPATAMKAVNQYQNEKRAIDYLTLGTAQAGEIPAPTPEVLGKYFEERKVLFRAPEYRKITLLAMSPAELAKPDAVTDADAKNYFEQHKASYGAPERRELQQIVFPNPEDATAARERIAKGASFADIAKERGLKESDIDRRHGDQGRDHRSGGRRCRLRAQVGRRQRAGQRPFRHRAAAGRQDRAGQPEDL